MQKTNKRRFSKACLIAVLVGAASTLAAAAPPVLHYSDLTWGPKNGWEGSSTKGAAVTIWGENLGSGRGTNYVTVNGATLSADTDYAEWGVAGPARGMQRITFWLNSNCADGAGNITVTVNGVASNPLPFNVAPGTIYFVSATSGNNSNNGLYSTAQGAANGPFRDLYMFGFQRNPSGDGQYLVYVRNGTYTAQDPSGDSTIISYRGPSGGPTRQKGLIAYPGETPVIDATGLTRGVIWNADYSPYGRNSYLTYSKLTVVNGNVAIDVFGDYIRVIGNHFQNMLDSVWSGVVFVSNSQYTNIHGNWFDHNGATVDGSYKHEIYVVSVALSVNIPTIYTYVGWNEFGDMVSGTDNRGGAVFFRTSSTGAGSRLFYLHDNYFHGGNQNFVEVGDGTPQSDVWIYNNLFVGGNSINYMVFIRWTTTNANLFNNTFYLAGAGSAGMVGMNGYGSGSQLYSANNIFYAAPGETIFSPTGPYYGTLTSDHDLFYSTSGPPALPPVGSTFTLTSPSYSDPRFVNPGANDFHLQSSSPAVDAGTSAVSSIVTEDFNGVGRPQAVTYDAGAFEYAAGGVTLPVVSVGISPTAISLLAGGMQQFGATVTGSSNTAVTWSLSPAVGTLSTSGLYSAPASITMQQTVQVTATSVADPTKFAAATITLNPPVGVSISPTASSLGQGQTQQFSAIVTGTSNTGLNWSLSPAVGTLSTTGLYTAPGSITTQQTVQVIATSVADPTKTATATITLNPPLAPPPTVVIGISPTLASLGQGQTQQFTATVTGTSNTGVTWSLSPAVGTLSTSGLYTAPSSIPSLQRVQVTATSVADPTKTVTATITLNPPSVPQANGFNITWQPISATQVQVSWTAPAGRPAGDYINLTGDGSPDWWFVWQKTTGGASSGSFIVNTPTSVGEWQFRYYYAGTYNVAATSSDILVGVANASITASSTVSSGKTVLTAQWTAPSDRPAGSSDLVGLYKIGTPNTQPITYKMVNGATSGTFTTAAPGTGSYEFRYVFGYTMATRSATIVVP